MSPYNEIDLPVGGGQISDALFPLANGQSEQAQPPDAQDVDLAKFYEEQKVLKSQAVSAATPIPDYENKVALDYYNEVKAEEAKKWSWLGESDFPDWNSYRQKNYSNWEELPAGDQKKAFDHWKKRHEEYWVGYKGVTHEDYSSAEEDQSDVLNGYLSGINEKQFSEDTKWVDDNEKLLSLNKLLTANFDSDSNASTGTFGRQWNARSAGLMADKAFSDIASYQQGINVFESMGYNRNPDGTIDPKQVEEAFSELANDANDYMVSIESGERLSKEDYSENAKINNQIKALSKIRGDDINDKIAKSQEWYARSRRIETHLMSQENPELMKKLSPYKKGSNGKVILGKDGKPLEKDGWEALRDFFSAPVGSSLFYAGQQMAQLSDTVPTQLAGSILAGPVGAFIAGGVAGARQESMAILRQLIEEDMQGKGLNPEDPNQLRSYTEDEQNFADLTAQAERKGITTGLVASVLSGVFHVGITKLRPRISAISNPLRRIAARGTTYGAAGFTSEAVSEAAGQLAQTGEISWAQVVQEGLAGIGSQVVFEGVANVGGQIRRAVGVKAEKASLPSGVKSPDKPPARTELTVQDMEAELAGKPDAVPYKKKGVFTTPPEELQFIPRPSTAEEAARVIAENSPDVIKSAEESAQAILEGQDRAIYETGSAILDKIIEEERSRTSPLQAQNLRADLARQEFYSSLNPQGRVDIQIPTTPAERSALFLEQELAVLDELKTKDEGMELLKRQLEEESVNARKKAEEEKAKLLATPAGQSATAIDQQLTQEERLRQSPEGLNTLKQELSSTEAQQQASQFTSQELDHLQYLGIFSPEERAQFVLGQIRKSQQGSQSIVSREIAKRLSALTAAEEYVRQSIGGMQQLREKLAAEAQAAQGGLTEAEIDELTGLPLNSDGTVTVYHGTTAAGAEQIRKTGVMRSAGEPDIYFTSAKEGTGYGDGTVVALDINPELLQLDDEFPDGRKDFRVEVGAKKTLKVKVRPDSPAPSSGAESMQQLREKLAAEAQAAQVTSDIENDIALKRALQNNATASALVGLSRIIGNETSPIERSKGKGMSIQQRYRNEQGGFLDIEAIGQGLANAAIEIFSQTKNFAEWSAKMIERFGDKVRKYLQKLWQNLTSLIRNTKDFLTLSPNANTERGAVDLRSPANIQKEADSFIKGFANTPKGGVRVITLEDLKKEYASNPQVQQGADALGVFDPNKQQITLVSDLVGGDKSLYKKVILHELVGHYGLQAVATPEQLDSIYKTIPYNELQAIRQSYGDQSPAVAAEEWIATRAGQELDSFLKRAGANAGMSLNSFADGLQNEALRNFFKMLSEKIAKLFGSGYTPTVDDAYQLMKRSYDFVKNGIQNKGMHASSPSNITRTGRIIQSDLTNSVSDIHGLSTSNPNALLLESGMAYRSVSEREVIDLAREGFHLTNPELIGKRKTSRGQTSKKMWSRKNENSPQIGYKPGQIVLRALEGNISVGTEGIATPSSAIEVLTFENGKWVSRSAEEFSALYAVDISNKSNGIPLSQRLNPQSNDIRFALSRASFNSILSQAGERAGGEIDNILKDINITYLDKIERKRLDNLMSSWKKSLSGKGPVVLRSFVKSELADIAKSSYRNYFDKQQAKYPDSLSDKKPSDFNSIKEVQAYVLTYDAKAIADQKKKDESIKKGLETKKNNAIKASDTNLANARQLAKQIVTSTPYKELSAEDRADAARALYFIANLPADKIPAKDKQRYVQAMNNMADGNFRGVSVIASEQVALQAVMSAAESNAAIGDNIFQPEGVNKISGFLNRIAGSNSLPLNLPLPSPIENTKAATNLRNLAFSSQAMAWMDKYIKPYIDAIQSKVAPMQELALEKLTQITKDLGFSENDETAFTRMDMAAFLSQYPEEGEQIKDMEKRLNDVRKGITAMLRNPATRLRAQLIDEPVFNDIINSLGSVATTTGEIKIFQGVTPDQVASAIQSALSSEEKEFLIRTGAILSEFTPRLKYVTEAVKGDVWRGYKRYHPGLVTSFEMDDKEDVSLVESGIMMAKDQEKLPSMRRTVSILNPRVGLGENQYYNFNALRSTMSAINQSIYEIETAKHRQLIHQIFKKDSESPMIDSVFGSQERRNNIKEVVQNTHRAELGIGIGASNPKTNSKAALVAGHFMGQLLSTSMAWVIGTVKMLPLQFLSPVAAYFGSRLVSPGDYSIGEQVSALAQYVSNWTSAQRKALEDLTAPNIKLRLKTADPLFEDIFSSDYASMMKRLSRDKTVSKLNIDDKVRKELKVGGVLSAIDKLADTIKKIPRAVNTYPDLLAARTLFVPELFAQLKKEGLIQTPEQFTPENISLIRNDERFARAVSNANIEIANALGAETRRSLRPAALTFAKFAAIRNLILNFRSIQLQYATDTSMYLSQSLYTNSKDPNAQAIMAMGRRGLAMNVIQGTLFGLGAAMLGQFIAGLLSGGLAEAEGADDEEKAMLARLNYLSMEAQKGGLAGRRAVYDLVKLLGGGLTAGFITNSVTEAGAVAAMKEAGMDELILGSIFEENEKLRALIKTESDPDKKAEYQDQIDVNKRINDYLQAESANGVDGGIIGVFSDIFFKGPKGSRIKDEERDRINQLYRKKTGKKIRQDESVLASLSRIPVITPTDLYGGQQKVDFAASLVLRGRKKAVLDSAGKEKVSVKPLVIPPPR